VAIVFGLD